MSQPLFPFTLRQRGRAAMDFLATLGKARAGLMPRVQAELAAAGVTATALPEALPTREAFVQARLPADSWLKRTDTLSDFIGHWHGIVAREAFDAIEPDCRATLDALESRGPATLRLDPDLAIPGYYRGVDFHRTQNGWDRHPEQGFIHGELIHKKLVGQSFDLFAQRRGAVRSLARRDFKQVLELGTSSGHYTTVLQQELPAARITGVDLSAPMLRQALRTANAHGWDWRLIQANAEALPFDDGAFDLVSAYSFFHELPETALRRVLAQAYRVLEPGGWMLLGDVTPFLAQDRLQQWLADRAAAQGGEPHWRESASLDWARLFADAGFTQVSAGGLDGGSFPWLVRGCKHD